MNDALLVLNIGSSSIKFALHEAGGERPRVLLRGQVAGIGTHPALSLSNAGIDTGGFAPLSASDRQGELVGRLLDWLGAQSDLGRIGAVGHRVVHGGGVYSGPTLVDEKVIVELSGFAPLAPLHQPHNVAGIEAVARRFPGLPQVACFDTAFHETQSPLAREFALPRDLTERGVRRYGFHGLSYEYIAGELPDRLGERAEGRVIVAHLGNGASLCAMRGRRSVATTMGFTALDGLVMARRCGALDPGVVLYMLRELGMSADEVEDVLYRRSGLLGVSGISSEMRVLEASDDPRARHAVELFCHRAATALCGLAGELKGLDAIVFTAGIGENSPRVRAGICARLGWLGVSLDSAANEANAGRISPEGHPLGVFVIPTDEERVIAGATRRLVFGAG